MHKSSIIGILYLYICHSVYQYKFFTLEILKQTPLIFGTVGLNKTLLGRIHFTAKMYWFRISFTIVSQFLQTCFIKYSSTHYKSQITPICKSYLKHCLIWWIFNDFRFIKKELHKITINQSQICLSIFHCVFSINNFIKILSGAAEKEFADWQTQAYNHEFILRTSHQKWPIM